jgi:hypothetical protein
LVSCFVIWYILWPFGIFSPVLVCCTKKNWLPNVHIFAKNVSTFMTNFYSRVLPANKLSFD